MDYIIENQFTELENTLLKIRIIKCGVRLCGHLSLLTEDLSEDFIVSSIYRNTESIDEFFF